MPIPPVGKWVAINGLLKRRIKSFPPPLTPYQPMYRSSLHKSILGCSQRRPLASSHKKEETYKMLKDAHSSRDYFFIKETAKEIGLILSRFAVAFGIHHIISTYCVDFLVCEGPSMLPTIQQKGEIIMIEKCSHRLFGLEGGDKGEIRSNNARQRQKKWEAMGTKEKWTKTGITSTDDKIWHASKLLPCYAENYNHMSTLRRSWDRVTSGINVGDVVVLEHPNHSGTVCKRVLGLPGDYVLRPKESRFFQSMNTKHREIMDIFHHVGQEDESRGVLPLASSSLLVIPDGHIWVEGDNSLNSADSRDYGPVPASLVLGKVWMKVWPVNGNSLLVRGDRPLPPEGKPFTGSTILPAGYEGELILVEKK